MRQKIIVEELNFFREQIFDLRLEILAGIHRAQDSFLIDQPDGGDRGDIIIERELRGPTLTVEVLRPRHFKTMNHLLHQALILIHVDADDFEALRLIFFVQLDDFRQGGDARPAP